MRCGAVRCYAALCGSVLRCAVLCCAVRCCAGGERRAVRCVARRFVAVRSKFDCTANRSEEGAAPIPPSSPPDESHDEIKKAISVLDRRIDTGGQAETRPIVIYHFHSSIINSSRQLTFSLL